MSYRSHYLTLALLAAGCAHPSSQWVKNGPPDASFQPATMQAFEACQREGTLIVYNGETYPLEIVAWRDMGPPWLVRAGIPAGAVDTIADLPGSTRILEAKPDTAHAIYSTGRVGGPPVNTPHNVYYSCAMRPQSGD